MRQFQECLLHHIQRRRAKLKPVCEKGGDIRRLAMAFEGCTDDRGATVEVMHGAIVLIPKRGPPGVGSALKPGQCLRCCTGCILGFAAPITRGFCDLPSPKRCRPARRGTAGGGPRRIRTPDPLIRSQVLYPAELSVHLRAVVYACRSQVATPKTQNLARIVQVALRTHNGQEARSRRPCVTSERTASRKPGSSPARRAAIIRRW